MDENNPNEPKAARLSRIATDLYDAEHILDAIHTQRRTQPKEIDPQVFPTHDQVNSELAGDFVAPRTPTEKRLAEIWSELLGIERVGIYDDFFDIGGHSILATQVLSRVHAAFQVELPLMELFMGTFTVAELAKAVEQHQIEQASKEDIAATLRELSQLTDDEVKELLASEEG